MHKKYLKYYLILLFVLLIPAAHNTLFLYRIGELHTPQEIAEIQYKNPECIYGSALKDDIFDSKVAMYKLKKPEVIAVGSSRILQMREEFFSKSFFNMGYVVSSAEAFDNVTDLLTPIHKPKVMIVNVDFWWFHKDYKYPGIDADKAMTSSRDLKLKYAVEPFKWLLSSKIDKDDYLFLGYESQKKNCGIGVKGYERSTGYGSDGSYYYTDLVTQGGSNTRIVANPDYKFKNIKERIEEGNGSFHYGSDYVEKFVDGFVVQMGELKDQGIEVVIYWPPLAPETLKMMQGKDYSYIKKLKDEFKKRGLEIHDYTDLGNASSNCEFIDGFHAGDVATARLLLDMAGKNNKLKEVLNLDYLQDAVEKYQGLAMIPDSKVTTKPEVDFLGIGCKK